MVDGNELITRVSKVQPSTFTITGDNGSSQTVDTSQTSVINNLISGEYDSIITIIKQELEQEDTNFYKLLWNKISSLDTNKIQEINKVTKEINNNFFIIYNFIKLVS